MIKQYLIKRIERVELKMMTPKIKQKMTEEEVMKVVQEENFKQTHLLL